MRGLRNSQVLHVNHNSSQGEKKIRFPSGKQKYKKHLDIETIRYNLYKDGFKPDYQAQTKYGEVIATKNQFDIGYVGSSFGGVHIGDLDMGNVTQENNFIRYQEMIFDTIGPELKCLPIFNHGSQTKR